MATKTARLEIRVPLDMLERLRDVAASEDRTVSLQVQHILRQALGAEEKLYELYLLSPGERKILCIRIVRSITNLGLKEAKDLVDASEHQPMLVLCTSDPAEAQEAKRTLEEDGATIEVRPR